LALASAGRDLDNDIAFRLALGSTTRIEDPNIRVIVLADISALLVQSGREEEGDNSFRDAMEMSAKITESGRTGQGAIASALAKAGRFDCSTSEFVREKGRVR
jgi:hypothetical protein